MLPYRPADGTLSTEAVRTAGSFFGTGTGRSFEAVGTVAGGTRVSVGAAFVAVGAVGVASWVGNCLTAPTTGVTVSTTDPATENGLTPLIPGTLVTLILTPLVVMWVVGPSSWARVAVTTAIACESPSAAKPSARPCPAGVTMIGSVAPILLTVAAMIPWIWLSPVPTMAAAVWMSIDIVVPWRDTAVVSAVTLTFLTTAASEA